MSSQDNITIERKLHFRLCSSLILSLHKDISRKNGSGHRCLVQRSQVILVSLSVPISRVTESLKILSYQFKRGNMALLISQW